MADYTGDLLPFSAGYLLASLPHLHERVILDPSKPSAVRVLGKSMHVLAAGWAIAIGWLWFATVQQGLAPQMAASEMLVAGIVPAVLLAVVGWLFARFAGRAPYVELERREWRHAFWWSLVPNAMLFATVWVMIQEAL